MIYYEANLQYFSKGNSVTKYLKKPVEFNRFFQIDQDKTSSAARN